MLSVLELPADREGVRNKTGDSHVSTISRNAEFATKEFEEGFAVFLVGIRVKIVERVLIVEMVNPISPYEFALDVDITKNACHRDCPGSVKSVVFRL